MPAISVINNNKYSDVSSLVEIHKDHKYDHRYTHEQYVSGSVEIHKTAYPSYPFTDLGDIGDGNKAFLEGEIYNKNINSIENTLKNFVSSSDLEQLLDWIRSLDGEFVFYIVNDSDGFLYVVPDQLTQLPIFYTCTAEEFLIGRNKLVLADYLNKNYDRQSVEDYFVLGYTLEGNTIFSDVKRLQAGECLTLDMRNMSISTKNFHKMNFDAELDKSENYGYDLSKLVTQACKRRTQRNNGVDIVLLSGGLDSRGILGAMHDLDDANLLTSTRQYKHDPFADIKYASQLSNSISVDWYKLSVDSVDIDHIIKHLYMTSGADPLDIAHMQPYLQKLRNSISMPCWTYTGDGGAFLGSRYGRLPSNNTDLPNMILKSEIELTNDVINNNTIFSIDDVESRIEELINNYPESTKVGKYLHYILYEHNFSWLFEATDTNRNHMWTTTPYYSNEVIKYAVQIPNDKKKDHKVFLGMTEQMAPELLDIPNPSMGTAPNDFTYMLRLKMFNNLQKREEVLRMLKPTIKRVLDLEGGTFESDSYIGICDDLRRNLGSNILNLIDIPTPELEQFSKNELFHILTTYSVLSLRNSGDLYDVYNKNL